MDDGGGSGGERKRACGSPVATPLAAVGPPNKRRPRATKRIAAHCRRPGNRVRVYILLAARPVRVASKTNVRFSLFESFLRSISDHTHARRKRLFRNGTRATVFAHKHGRGRSSRRPHRRRCNSLGPRRASFPCENVSSITRFET